MAITKTRSKIVCLGVESGCANANNETSLSFIMIRGTMAVPWRCIITGNSAMVVHTYDLRIGSAFLISIFVLTLSAPFRA